MAHTINNIIADLESFETKIAAIQEIILSNLIMISEIHASTFHEERRSQLLIERFSESHLNHCSTDECNNAVGILNGKDGARNILVVAHLDTIFGDQHDTTVTIEEDYARGSGISDNSLGVAVITSLPHILAHLNITFNANIILMGSARSLGSGNIEGLRFFLDNSSYKIDNTICVEGVELGRLSVGSIGMWRSQLTLTKPDILDWSRFDVSSAIADMNDIVNQIQEIPLPRRPRSTIVLNAIHADASFSQVPTSAELRYEIRSESSAMVEHIAKSVEHIADEIASRSGSTINITTIARRNPGGMPFSHPMVRCAREILNVIGCETRIQPSTSELSACIDRSIPAITIGVSHCTNLNTPKEKLDINLIPKGVAQLIGMLCAIDQGLCDESE